MSETNGKRAIPELSIDARLLAERLEKCQFGEIVPYDELSKVVGRNVRERQGYSQLQAARRVVMRERRMVFAAVTGEGLKRCDDAGIVAVAGSYVDRIHRMTKKSISTLACADFDKLDNSTRIELNAKASQLAVLDQLTTNKAQQKIAAAVKQAEDRLPLAKTLEVFR